MQAHSENFNIGIQALMLLHKITSKNQVASDRFYRALYAKLLLPAAMNSSKASYMCFISFCCRTWVGRVSWKWKAYLCKFQAEMFIGLLIRAMKSDLNLKRVAAFAKRVMQVLMNCILALWVFFFRWAYSFPVSSTCAFAKLLFL